MSLRFTDDGLVQITLTREDYEAVLAAMGTTAGVYAQQRDLQGLQGALSLINRVCAGHPKFRPYELPDESCSIHVKDPAIR
jgi:hypothetical protein